MIQVAVCDDNAIHLKHTVSIIEKAFSDDSVQTFSFSSAEAMSDKIQEKLCSPDIAVLDIKMRETNGIRLAEQLNRIIPHCQIIFLTGYPDYASEVYLTHHVWFVLKDQADTFLVPALKRAAANLSVSESGGMVSVRCEGKSLLLSISDIIYLEHVGRKTRIVCKDNNSYLSSKQPLTIQQQLVRCHQGYWINLSHVAMLDHNEFIMDDNSRIPISRSFRENVRSQFFNMIRL